MIHVVFNVSGLFFNKELFIVKLFIGVILTFFISKSYSQEESIIWLNDNWEETTKSKAKYYRKFEC